MFRKLFGGGATRPAADPYALPARRRSGVYTLDALGDVRVLALVQAAEAEDWEAVKAGLAPFDLGRDHRVLAQLADVDGVQDWIGRAAEEDKEHRATALLISGARHVAWGWEARTSARAVNVSREQWQVFYQRLRIAEEQLLEAAELRPEWVTPWRRLLTSGRGMSLGSAVNEARLDAALRRDPLDLETHIEWVSYLQPRWSGEPGQALAFAREAVAGAPGGHRLGCLIAVALIEEGYEKIEGWFESQEAARFRTPEIQAELRHAADHSILHPAYVRRPGWQEDFNTFASALSLAGESQAIQHVFKALDGAYTPSAWRYWAEPEKRFAQHNRRA